MATIRSGSRSDSTSPNQNTSAAAPRTESGTAFITDPIEVGAYDHRFAKLERVAVFGDEARTVFARVADEYRALGEPTRGTGGPIRSR